MTWTPKRIRGLRHAAGMTQSQLATWLGVTRAHVSHIEGGQRPAGQQTIRLLELLVERIPSPGKRRKQL
jgi:transcriptional regulator with XRE-family HTH domain